MNPQQVKDYIANKNVTNATKQKLVNVYDYFCKANNLEWTKPKYKWERKIPLIPTTANIDKIISASSTKYATIFTILKETGVEGRELATTTRNNIDAEQGIINVQGCKGHNSRSIKLKPKTADMLRVYLELYKGEHPFPSSRRFGERWRRIRNRLADKLNELQLKAIPLRNLRHYYATRLYDKTKDILLVKQMLGHKKIETTMFYTQLITFTEDDEYTCKTASNIKEATDLIEHGFKHNRNGRTKTVPKTQMTIFFSIQVNHSEPLLTSLRSVRTYLCPRSAQCRCVNLQRVRVVFFKPFDFSAISSFPDSTVITPFKP
jgi:integrase